MGLERMAMEFGERRRVSWDHGKLAGVTDISSFRLVSLSPSREALGPADDSSDIAHLQGR